MQSNKMEEILTGFYRELHGVIDGLPEKAMAKKHRRKLEKIKRGVIPVMNTWDEIKMSLLQTEEEALEQGREDAKRLMHYFNRRDADGPQEAIDKFLGKDTIHSYDLDWGDELFASVVDVEVARLLKKEVENGATRDELIQFAQECLLQEVRSLSSSSSATRNLVTEHKAKTWARYLDRI